MEKIKAFGCGPYRSYECLIKRKYSKDRRPVVLPQEFTCLIVPDDMHDEVLEILSTRHCLVSPQGNH